MWSFGAGSRMRYGANATAVHGFYVQLQLYLVVDAEFILDTQPSTVQHGGRAHIPAGSAWRHGGITVPLRPHRLSMERCACRDAIGLRDLSEAPIASIVLQRRVR